VLLVGRMGSKPCPRKPAPGLGFRENHELAPHEHAGEFPPKRATMC
jgi:hypothetical protein